MVDCMCSFLLIDPYCVRGFVEVAANVTVGRGALNKCSSTCCGFLYDRYQGSYMIQWFLHCCAEIQHPLFCSQDQGMEASTVQHNLYWQA
jgi:hypothetical protein